MLTAPLHGARLIGPHTTRFSLWAPDCRSVAVELMDGALHPLAEEPGGWFGGEVECSAGTSYRYIVDGERRVPDPASRRQAGDVHGFSMVVDPATYSWRVKDWPGRPWHEAVIYELHVGLLGGFAEVEAYLPTLLALGVTAVELMPLGEFPGKRNWGYDGVLPFAPDSSYGTPDELCSLVDRAHELGLMVLVDVVYNHFGPEGNYLGHYAADFFRRDRQTPWGDAIDFRKREVREFFIENALMWLQDYRMDGLRIDAVHAIRDIAFMLELADRVRASASRKRHLHLVLENEANEASLLERGYDAQWNDDAHNALHVLLTGEHHGYYEDFAEAPALKLATCLAEGFAYQGQSDRHGFPRGEPSVHLRPGAFVLFLQNHDQVGNRAYGERLPALADLDALKAATVLLLLSPMIPLLFMGEEWGSTQPFLYFTDHPPALGAAVREGRRNEFATFPHFSDAVLRENIPDPNAARTFNRCLPDLDLVNQLRHRECLALYRSLISLRHARIIPRLPGSHALESGVLGSHAVSAAWRMGDGARLDILINLGESPAPMEPAGSNAEILFAHRIEGADLAECRMPPRSALALLEPA
ncbi:malto-oligosyltrehalose trehalohydrolase [Pseudomonas sp. JS3066]|uniref:malto-oligosyltrehalose trehalohydrolase n=1 Tax=Pseudomonas sp. JS3066 TaxID=3090665 RepID=UPI002E7B749F|nr:malto-oligosyltrehalose trehalohydrolase [Pseudomonas sp. JS3066]WVK95777.1 malto-oligosyltrehalose trehalohydrolase [Pseudomonas sp. JS3066]